MAINSSDFSPASLSGTVTINSGAGTISANIAADVTTEGPEKFIIKLRTGSITGPIVATSNTIVINDTSLDAEVPPVEPPVDNTPTYSFLANVASASEGQAVRFTLNTTNLSNGNLVPYSITGVASADIGGAPLSGNFTINNNTASLDLPITADLATEGTETLTVRLTSAPSNPSVAITIVDSSVAPPVGGATYELKSGLFNTTPATTITINEQAGTVYFYLSVFNASDIWGTDVPYTITGIKYRDLSIGHSTALQGSFSIPQTPAANPVDQIALPIGADLMTEGVETLVMTLDGKNVSTSVIINDTSTTPALPPTYNFALYTSSSYGPTRNQVYEYVNPPGSAYVDFVLLTTNIVPGTTLPFSISGIQQGDVTSPGLTWNSVTSKFTGVFVMQDVESPPGTPYNQQIAQIKVDIVADALTEGNELMELSLDNGQAAVAITILDTSTGGPSVFTVTPATSSVNEGSPMIYTVGGSNIPNGTYYWTIQNSMNFLNDFGTFSGSFTITSNAGTFSVTPSADLLTEGSETFSIELRTGSVTGPVVFTGAPVTINDSSITPVVSGTFTISTSNTRAVPLEMPAAATWLAFRIIGAGGAGAGPDASGPGGSGGGGQYARGIVKLPATSGPKTIYGFAGRPARGGTSSGRVYNLGGEGENCAPGADASGAQGEINGPSGSSGEGGGGGGASSLYYTVAGSSTYIPLVTVGGGGGGGGGSHRRQDYGNANGENKGFITFGAGLTGSTPIPGLKPEWCRLDGGGGGGGGGAGGKEGFCGNDNDRGSVGGSAGYVIRNDSDGLVWNTFDWYGIGPVPPATEGVAVEAPQPYPWAVFGRGGIGAVAPGYYGQGGQMGAIAVHYTTAVDPPGYSSVPDWVPPTVIIPASILPDKDMQAGLSSVTFYSWGEVSYNIDGNIGTSCFIQTQWGNQPINGVGEFLEILIVSAAPSSGQNRGNLISNIVENTWTPLKPTGPQGYYIGIQNDFADVTVTIRRRDNQAVLRTVRYFNVSGYPSYNYGNAEIF